MSITETARGRWYEILCDVGGLSAAVLDGKHRPCPICLEGDDRFVFDDRGGNGTWLCRQCPAPPGKQAAAGTGIDLLMQAKGWDFKRAAEEIERFLGVSTSTTPRPRQRSAPKSAPKPTPPAPPSEAPFALSILNGVDPHRGGPPYLYSPTQRVGRFITKTGKKVFPVHHLVGDQWVKGAGPAPWPLYNHAACLAAKGWIIEAEGEKCADIITAQGLVATTQPGHQRKLNDIVRRYRQLKEAGVSGIIYLADHDIVDGIKKKKNDGLVRAATSAEAAAKAGLPFITVPAIDLWPDLPDGGSIDDAPDPEAALDALEAHAVNLHHEILSAPPPPPEPPEEPPADTPWPPDYPFDVLGCDGGRHFYLERRSGSVLSLSASAHTSLNLVDLADEDFWASSYTNPRGKIEWLSAAADLLARQRGIGIFDTARIRGRGAWWDQHRSILHLGDRLIIDGESHRLPTSIASHYVYPIRKRLTGPSRSEALDDEEALAILQLAHRFLWQVPASGMLLAGWVVLAPICGALSWRPHVWVTATPASGKSTLFDRFIVKLLSDLAHVYIGSGVTEPGIRQELGSDALPVVIDEAEGNSKADRTRIEAILTLSRAAASAAGARVIKGTPGGGALSYHVRSMFLFSSVTSGVKLSSDQRRIVELGMRSPNTLPPVERAAHWKALDQDLETITPELAQRLIRRTLNNLPHILQGIATFRRVAAAHFGSQALGDQFGTLLAGAWSLQSSQPPTDEQALLLITTQDWQSYTEKLEVSDEQDCLETILQHQLQVDADTHRVTRTVRDLIAIAVEGGILNGADVSTREAERVLGYHGIKISEGRLLIANRSEGLKRIMADTSWSGNWSSALKRLPGAEALKNPQRFPGTGVSRATSIPLPD